MFLHCDDEIKTDVRKCCFSHLIINKSLEHAVGSLYCITRVVGNCADRNSVSGVQARAVTSLPHGLRGSRHQGESITCARIVHVLGWAAYKLHELIRAVGCSKVGDFSNRLQPTSVGPPPVASLLWDASHATNTKPCTVWVND